MWMKNKDKHRQNPKASYGQRNAQTATETLKLMYKVQICASDKETCA